MALVLASASRHRLQLLRNAGLDVEAVPSGLDERALEAPLADAAPEDVAAILAEAKAVEVAGARPGDLVIGADQTLALGDALLHKAADMEEARRTLLALSGRTHRLHSAVVIARGPEVLWRHVSSAALTMRPLSPPFIGHYLARVGEAALTSVGCYQIEGEGIQLMERVEGDHFTVVGLPMLPLLAELRRLGAIES